MKLTKKQKAKLQETKEKFTRLMEYTNHYYDLHDITRMVFIEGMTTQEIANAYDDFQSQMAMELSEERLAY